MSRRPRSETLVRACCCVMPPGYRDGYADEVAEILVERVRDERRRGGTLAALVYGGAAMVDLIRSGARMRWARMRRTDSAARVVTDARTPGRGGGAMPGGGPQRGGDSDGLPSRVLHTLLGLARDLRYGMRTLLHRPGFALTVIATLAIGIGANTIVFSIANVALLQPLPFEDPERLVGLYRADPDVTGMNPTPERVANVWAVPYPVYRDWAAMSPVFESSGAHRPVVYTLTGGERAERILGLAVTSGVLPTLGVRPYLGRLLLEEDDVLGAPSVVVLSHGIWQRRFAGERDIVGADLALNGTAHTIIGVAPEGFSFPNEGIEIWTSFSDSAKEAEGRAGGNLQVVARLRGAVSMDDARTELAAVAARIGEAHPEEKEHGIGLFSLRELTVAESRPALVLFLAAVGIVLLVACANVAGLMLVRSLERRQEMAIRVALGAGRGRVVLQQLAESLVLSLAGGAAGLAIAYGGLGPFLAVYPRGLPRAGDIAIDSRAVLFLVGVSVATGLAMGLIPALRSADAVAEVTRGGRRTQTADRRRSRAQAGLVVAQVALAFALLTGAALLAKSFVYLAGVDQGFDADGIVAVEIRLPDAYRESDEACSGFLADLTARAEAIPGVTGVGMAEQVPFMGGTSHPPMLIETSSDLVKGNVHLTSITASYFDVLGVPIVSGRGISGDDRSGTLPVAVVNEAMVEDHWPGEDPLGRRVKIDHPDYDMWYTVVGVVGDFSYYHGTGAFPSIYVAFEQDPGWYQIFLVDVAGDPTAAIHPLREAVGAVDPDIPVTPLLLTEAMRDSPGIESTRFGATALALLALVAAGLAVLGVYGILAAAVAQRTHELGVRIALGAQRADLIRDVLGRGLIMAGAGLVAGLAMALLGGRVISSLLFGVEPTDPFTLAQVGVLILVVVSAAGLIPARRATAIDPVEALRKE